MYWIIPLIVIVGVLLYRRQSTNRARKQFVDVISHMGGMSYSLADESEIMRTLKSKSIQEIAEYADVVAKANATDAAFLESQLPGFTREAMQKRMDDPVTREHDLNPTSIGNIACIAIDAPPPYNAIARESFDLIISYL